MPRVYGTIYGDGALYELDDNELAGSTDYWYSLRNGEVNCTRCGGEGKIECDACDHSGECSECHGDGSVECDTTEIGEPFEIVAWDVIDVAAFKLAVAEGADGYERLGLARSLGGVEFKIDSWEP